MSKNPRNSSLELFKIIGIILIILSHVVQTLDGNGNGVDLNVPTTNLQYLIIAMMRYCGTIGNIIFFVCSAWFLLDSEVFNKKKILQMITDVWAVSVVILIIVLILRKGNLNKALILMSLLPNTFGNNWYICCYLLFYAIHPALNKVMHGLNQRQMLRTIFIMTLLYLIISFLTIFTGHLFGASNNFFHSFLITWVVIYFIIGYEKFYVEKTFCNKKLNYWLVIIGFIGNYGLILITNFFELKTGLLNHAVQIWNVDYNPFLIMLVIGLFNLSKRKFFVNKTINYISKLSLYIYIIHENLLLRRLYRPAMWNYVYTHFGYDHILIWVGVFVIVIFIFGVMTSMVYVESLHKLTVKECEKIYPKLKTVCMSFENKLLKYH